MRAQLVDGLLCAGSDFEKAYSAVVFALYLVEVDAQLLGVRCIEFNQSLSCAYVVAYFYVDFFDTVGGGRRYVIDVLGFYSCGVLF